MITRSREAREDREVVGPRELEAAGDAERETLARELESRDPAVALWVTVLQAAFDDLAYLRDRAEQADLRRHERKRLQQIREHDPVRFFESRWFEQICDYLGLDADAVRPPEAELRRLESVA